MLGVYGWVEYDLTYMLFNGGNAGGVLLHSAPSCGSLPSKSLLRYTEVGHTSLVASPMVSTTPDGVPPPPLCIAPDLLLSQSADKVPND